MHIKQLIQVTYFLNFTKLFLVLRTFVYVKQNFRIREIPLIFYPAPLVKQKNTNNLSLIALIIMLYKIIKTLNIVLVKIFKVIYFFVLDEKKGIPGVQLYNQKH